MGGRKGRDGIYPATSCIKIAGYFGEMVHGDPMGKQLKSTLIQPNSCMLFFADETGITITVRGCALDSGTLTTDTEIIRMSHCGRFYYDDKYAFFRLLIFFTVAHKLQRSVSRSFQFALRVKCILISRAFI